MEPKIAIELTVRDWNVVLTAAAHRPYLEVADIINSIRTQSEAKLEQMSKVAQAFNGAVPEVEKKDAA